MKMFKHLIVDSLLILSLLGPTLFPNIQQTVYFEQVARVLISIINIVAFLAVLAYLAGDNYTTKSFARKKERSVGEDTYDFVSDVALSLVAIYTGHYTLATCYIILKTMLCSCRENAQERGRR